ncbi:MAG: hypothetical protein XE06_1427 [Anaerolineaceae bacterium 46_22]|nr:MAG: hypothetical protein XE06_1427 [Anaerolineaceae bacterium 46_22]
MITGLSNRTRIEDAFVIQYQGLINIQAVHSCRFKRPFFLNINTGDVRIFPVQCGHPLYIPIPDC